MTSTTNSNRKMILLCICNSQSDVFGSLDECDNFGIGLCIYSPTTDSPCVISISRCRNVALEGLFERGKVRHWWGRKGKEYSYRAPMSRRYKIASHCQ